MAGYFNIKLPGSPTFPQPEKETVVMQKDLSLEKFFDLVDEVSNGDAELLKFKDDDCM